MTLMQELLDENITYTKRNENIKKYIYPRAMHNITRLYTIQFLSQISRYFTSKEPAKN